LKFSAVRLLNFENRHTGFKKLSRQGIFWNPRIQRGDKGGFKSVVIRSRDPEEINRKKIFLKNCFDFLLSSKIY